MNILNTEQLAETLHRANSGVPYWCRYAFYGAKDFILGWLGTPDGHDIQSLDRECWECGGKGHRTILDACPKCGGIGGALLFPTCVFCHGLGRCAVPVDCRKCGGTGVYSYRRIWLDRYKFGPYTFHRPVTSASTSAMVTIRGRVTHQAYEDSANLAVMLAWTFNREQLQSATVEHEFSLTSSRAMPVHYVDPWWQAVERWRSEAEQDRVWRAKQWERRCAESGLSAETPF